MFGLFLHKFELKNIFKRFMRPCKKLLHSILTEIIFLKIVLNFCNYQYLFKADLPNNNKKMYIYIYKSEHLFKNY